MVHCLNIPQDPQKLIDIRFKLGILGRRKDIDRLVNYLYIRRMLIHFAASVYEHREIFFVFPRVLFRDPTHKVENCVSQFGPFVFFIC